MKKKFSLSGMPDFNPLQIKRREYALSVIRESFEIFGFSPIQTSIVEKRENLFGSYGDDGDKLIFQILRSGDYLNKIDINLKNINCNELSSLISDKALRYDLTVPFARFVSENQSTINFPFRRYEIGSVFRADRPQKGRLRQFTQCDADIIGSKSLWLEIDLLTLVDYTLNKFGLTNTVIKISNRKILEGLFESFVSNISFSKFCIIIDKLDKIGLDKIGELLLDSGFVQKDINFIKNLFLLEGSFSDKKSYILSALTINDNLQLGFEELSFLIDNIQKLSLVQNIEIDFSLARGIDYYTGSIFEVSSLSGNIGSLLGGGRYDQLTEKFHIKDVSGVGVSFGLDRLCLTLDDAGLFPDDINNNIDCLFINFGLEEAKISQSYILQLRQFNISSELYPDSVKLNKQMNYANKRGAKFVVMIGEEEIKQNKIMLKNMLNGKQELLSFDELLKIL